jgi:hypothetical protein
VVGTVADDVFKELGIVNDVELAPILAGTLAHNAGECRNNMLQPGSDSLRDPAPGGPDAGQESDRQQRSSLQQRLVKTGGRLLKHARYYWLLLAESHLTRRLFGAMVRRIGSLSVPAG